MNQKEIALQRAIENALRQYSEFYVNDTKKEDVSIVWLLIENARCVCPAGLDSSSWEQCKDGLFDVELNIRYKNGNDGSCESIYITCISIEFSVIDYKDGVFTVEITSDKVYLTRK